MVQLDHGIAAATCKDVIDDATVNSQLVEDAHLGRLFADGSVCIGIVSSVYSFLPWQQRICDAPQLSKFMSQLFEERGHFWHGLCEQLCAEGRLYFPFEHAEARLLAGGDGNWRALFMEMWPLRHRFLMAPADQHQAGAAEVPAERFQLATHCRMRPAKSEVRGDIAPPMAVSLNLMPLHQRIALLKQRQPELTHTQAMQQLLAQDKSEPSSSTPGDETRSSGFTASVLSVNSGAVGTVLTVSPGIGIRSWEFDNVFPESSRQQDIHGQCGLRLALDLVNGSSGALLVYGQTGSGKTYTMFGPAGSMKTAAEVGSAPMGLVPRIADEVLAGIEKRRAAGFEVKLGASYVEVFGSNVKNLIGDAISSTQSANDLLGHRHVLNGRWEVDVPSQQALMQILLKGEDSKRQASTAMNEHSSRAHTLVLLHLSQRAPGQESFIESTLSLVDLGGSERVSKSKANENIRNPGALRCGDEELHKVTWAEYYEGRERITETNYINKGLLTIKRCIHALIERQKAAEQGTRLPRIPFKDDKLTMLLEPALGGDSRTSIIVCCSPEEEHADETVQSLRFGEMCSRVQQERSHGAAPDANAAIAHALEAMDNELKAVEAEIRQKERLEWRAKTQVHIVSELDAGGTVLKKDEICELGGAGAVEFHADDGSSIKREVEHQVWGQVFVGAEAENARREELLKRRQRLLGGGDSI